MFPLLLCYPSLPSLSCRIMCWHHRFIYSFLNCRGVGWLEPPTAGAKLDVFTEAEHEAYFLEKAKIRV